MNNFCWLCGLKLKIHTDSKCIKILHLERQALFQACSAILVAINDSAQKTDGPSRYTIEISGSEIDAVRAAVNKATAQERSR